MGREMKTVIKYYLQWKNIAKDKFGNEDEWKDVLFKNNPTTKVGIANEWIKSFRKIPHIEFRVLKQTTVTNETVIANSNEEEQ